MWYRLGNKTEADKKWKPKRGVIRAAIILDRHGIPYQVRRRVQPFNEDFDSTKAARKVYLFIDYQNPQQETMLNLLLGNHVQVELVDTYGDTQEPEAAQLIGWYNVYDYVLSEGNF